MKATTGNGDVPTASQDEAQRIRDPFRLARNRRPRTVESRRSYRRA